MRGLDADCFRQPPREKAARLERRPVPNRCRTVPLCNTAVPWPSRTPFDRQDDLL